jgi:uncharacterized protein YcgI (DUF1989 family)
VIPCIIIAACPQDQDEDHVFMKIETHVYSVDSDVAGRLVPSVN